MLSELIFNKNLYYGTQRGSQTQGDSLGREERQEAEGLQRVGVDRSSTGDIGSIRAGSRGVSELPAGNQRETQ